ncbi:MAG: MgtC/SapB family protein [Clostridia bacterium]|nr:MgtC/SapB family protein [Clostridia bacterium]
MEVSEFQTLFKLVLITILAGIIGYERESWKKPAGFRTYILVAISSVLVMECGNRLYSDIGADPTRIPAQLLSGIGFLGAGTILRDGFNVKGLTTAAALLAVTCVGLIVGAGYYLSAILATFVIYCVLSYSHVLSDKLERFNFLDLEIIVDNPKTIIDEVKNILTGNEVEIVKMKVYDEKGVSYIKLEGKYREKIEINYIMSRIMSLEPVKEVVEVKEVD